MEVKAVSNLNRTNISTSNLTADFVSDVIDFRDMPIGSLQAVWNGANAADGYFEVYSSNFRELATFDNVRGSKEEVKVADGSRVWNLGLIGFRSALVKWIHGSNTAGTCLVVAMGKKT
jgi:hypothetical protein